MNRSAVVTVLAAAAVLTLGGCGGSNDKAPAATTSASQPAADAPTTGCTLTPSEELYVRKYYVCDSRSTAVYTFDSTDQRDNWWKAASAAGSVKDGQGDLWIEVKQ